jgi:hypothetical protein
MAITAYSVRWSGYTTATSNRVELGHFGKAEVVVYHDPDVEDYTRELLAKDNIVERLSGRGRSRILTPLLLTLLL